MTRKVIAGGTILIAAVAGIWWIATTTSIPLILAILVGFLTLLWLLGKFANIEF